MTHLVHSYDNDFPADVLPRGSFLGTWTGHYVVLDEGGAYVPTDAAVSDAVRVTLHVTDRTVGVEIVGLRGGLVAGRDVVYRRCRCGETAHRVESVLVGGKPAGFLYKCRNCHMAYSGWRNTRAGFWVADPPDPS